MANRQSPVRLRLLLQHQTNFNQEVQAMANYVDDVEDSSGGRLEAGADPQFDEHERLALALLAVRPGPSAEVADSMRQIIASAPDSTDVALVLLLAISHAEDRALEAQLASANPTVGDSGGPDD